MSRASEDFSIIIFLLWGEGGFVTVDSDSEPAFLCMKPFIHSCLYYEKQIMACMTR